MDWVHEVVHGPGPHGWSMDPGPCFVYIPLHHQSTMTHPEALSLQLIIIDSQVF